MVLPAWAPWCRLASVHFCSPINVYIIMFVDISAQGYIDKNSGNNE